MQWQQASSRVCFEYAWLQRKKKYPKDQGGSTAAGTARHQSTAKHRHASKKKGPNRSLASATPAATHLGDAASGRPACTATRTHKSTIKAGQRKANVPRTRRTQREGCQSHAPQNRHTGSGAGTREFGAPMRATRGHSGVGCTQKRYKIKNKRPL